MAHPRRRKKLLVLLAPFQFSQKNTVAATLAWMCEASGRLFELYYDAFRIGDHFGGGNYERHRPGTAFGSTVTGHQHFEQFYYLNQAFDTEYVVAGGSLFETAVVNLGRPVIVKSEDPVQIYRTVVSHLNLAFPTSCIVSGQGSGPLAGLDAFSYPDIFMNRFFGLTGPVSSGTLKALREAGIRELATLYLPEESMLEAGRMGFSIRPIDLIGPQDDYSSITTRLCGRWKEAAQHYILGDPILISHWIPWACRKRRWPLYGRPQTRVIQAIGNCLGQTPEPLYGRQYADEDFLELSKRGQCIQLIDPVRPPFPVVEEASYVWPSRLDTVDEKEPVDAELLRWAEEGKILTSLVFWAANLREFETFPRLFELVQLTGLRAGLVTLAPQYRFFGHGTLELLYQPVERGGVFPLLEPLLGSSGTGCLFEGYLDPSRLKEHLKRAREEISMAVGPAYIPRGWWALLDSELVPADAVGAPLDRPFAGRHPGALNPQIVDAVAGSGFEYMISKTNFGAPRLLQGDDRFSVINLTAGGWDGWTPFYTISDLKDLTEAEERLSRSPGPGWLLSNIDACLWAFSMSHWERGAVLKTMADYLRGGGRKGRLINTTPHVISRYARLLARTRPGQDRGRRINGLAKRLAKLQNRFAVAFAKFSGGCRPGGPRRA